MFINTAIIATSLKIFCNLLFYLLTFTILGFLLPTNILSPIETSGFYDSLLNIQYSSASKNGFSIYQNPAGLAIGYPSNWQKVELEPQGFITFRPIEGSAAVVVGNKSIDLPTLFRTPQEGLQFLESEVNKTKLEQFGNNETGFKLLESNMTTLDGNPAAKLVYLQKSDPEPKKEAKVIELLSIKDGTRYSVTFRADVNEFNHYEPTFQKMINSINITEPIGLHSVA
jgi:hypothetical protein